MLNKLFKSIIDSDTAPVVICNMDSVVVYMNPSAVRCYCKDLTGVSVKDCHTEESNRKIDKVVDWFRKSIDNNIMHTYYSERENKDVYMVALRDSDGTLIGYYEKHENRSKETAHTYNF